jgi:hypothetical protein
MHIVGEHRVPDGLELEHDLFEPQLEYLMDLDEEQLVVSRGIGQQSLLIEQLVDP